MKINFSSIGSKSSFAAPSIFWMSRTNASSSSSSTTERSRACEQGVERLHAEEKRKPLLNRTEFQEAVFRLAYLYDASKDPDFTGHMGVGPKGGSFAVRRRAQRRRMQEQNLTAFATAGTISSEIQGRGGDEESDFYGEDEEWEKQVETTVLANLPGVCGKLLALLEQICDLPGAFVR